MKTYKQFIEERVCDCEDCIDCDCENCDCHELVEAEYQGRKVTLNKPTRNPKGDKKKFSVYVKNDKGNIVKVG